MRPINIEIAIEIGNGPSAIRVYSISIPISIWISMPLFRLVHAKIRMADYCASGFIFISSPSTSLILISLSMAKYAVFTSFLPPLG